MTGEFTAFSNHYYKLTKLLSARHERFQILVDNAPLYGGQTRLSEVDEIISYYRDVQAAKAQIDKTLADMKETERNILMIMRHFEIPPGTMLTGAMPGELEYELWAGSDDAVYTSKSKDLPPEPLDPNIMVIKLWNPNDVKEEG